MFEVLCITVNTAKKTTGVMARNLKSQEIRWFSTGELKQLTKSEMFSNAIVCSDGFVRGKSTNTKPIPKKVFAPASNVNAQSRKDAFEADKLLKCMPLHLYHGNKNANMRPKYGKGTSNNDYGVGFYTTPDAELAKEWAYAAYTKVTWDIYILILWM